MIYPTNPMKAASAGDEKAEPTDQIAMFMSILTDRIAKLAETAMMLGQQLNPILAPEGTQPTGADKLTEHRSLCPLAELLYARTQALNEVEQILLRVSNRVRL
jgi:hypothetical protein